MDTPLYNHLVTILSSVKSHIGNCHVKIPYDAYYKYADKLEANMYIEYS